MTDQTQAIPKAQNDLIDRILPMIDSVVKDRKAHWEKQDKSAIDSSLVPSLIASYARTCGLIAGGLNLVPGPWGLVAVIPEIAGIMHQQLMMIYDIGRLYGQEPNRELLLAVLLSGTGTGTGGLVVIKGSKVIVKRASLRLLQKLIELLGGKVTQAALRSFLAKWVPLAGAAAIALWARHSTIKLGQRAQGLFSKSIEFSDDVVDVEGAGPEPTAAPEQAPGSMLAEKVKLLGGLMWVDREAHPQELEFIRPLLADPDISEEARERLAASVVSGRFEPVAYDLFAPEERVAVLMDLVALAHVDGRFHPAERLFIKEVGKKLGLSDEDVKEILEVEMG